MRAVLLFLCVLGSGLSAQEPDTDQMLGAIRVCLDKQDSIDGERACISVPTELCIAAGPDNQSTQGMAACTRAETQAWDVLLNETYQGLLAVLKAADQAGAEYGEPAERVDSLRAAQRAWIAFRDADCANEYAIWGLGSMRILASSACFLDMTAARVLDLRARAAMLAL